MKHLSAIWVNIGLYPAHKEKRQEIKIKVRREGDNAGEEVPINRLISIGKADQKEASRPEYAGRER